MDIYEYLKMDHDKFSHLFTLFNKSKISQRREEIVRILMQELLVHAHSEQETFYKALEAYPDICKDISHFEKEHKEIADQIKIIHRAVSEKKWVNAVLDLQEIVEHHVKEEEGKIFKEAKKVLSEQQALIIKEEMHYLKGKYVLLLENERQKTADKKTQSKQTPAHTKAKVGSRRPADKTSGHIPMH